MRQKERDGERERVVAREICHFNGHFYGLGELGGSQTAPLLTAVRQTPDRCISVRALLSQSERQMYLSRVKVTAGLDLSDCWVGQRKPQAERRGHKGAISFHSFSLLSSSLLSDMSGN